MKKLIDIPEWSQLKRCVLNLGFELPEAVHRDVVRIFNEAAAAVQVVLDPAPPASTQALEAQGIARLAPAAAAGAGVPSSPTIGTLLAQPGGEQAVAEILEQRNARQAALSAAIEHGFTIGPNNTYQQAWAAMLVGHQVRRAGWQENASWIFARNAQEIHLVWGKTLSEWRQNPSAARPFGVDQLATDWEVLPIIHHETPVV